MHALGARGTRPVRFACSMAQAQQLVGFLPGVTYAPGGVACAWDAAGVVARFLGTDAPPLPTVKADALPGLAEYRRLGLGKVSRPYQHEDEAFLVQRSAAMLCQPPRAGKTLTALAAACLMAAERVLVLAPAIAKWVWADEIAKWLGKSALLVEGLACSDVKRYCLACMQSGRAADGSRCPACRARNGSSYGYTITEVHKTEAPIVARAKEGDLRWRCRKHPEFDSDPDQPTRCERCLDDLIVELRKPGYVLCNYELLQAHAKRDKRGRVTAPKHLRGWAEVLASIQWDLVMLDESHELRGWDTTRKRRGKLRKDIVKRVVAGAPAVWGITGTPIFGYTRDLYGQLDVITNGMWGDPAIWANRYAGAVKGAYGMIADGSSNEDELAERLSVIKVQRPRSEILPYMPAKQRDVYYIDNPKPARRRRDGELPGTMGQLIAAIAPIKRPVIVDRVLEELSAGEKVYVLTFRRNSCEAMAKALETAIAKRAWRARMQAVNAQVFAAQTEAGIGPKARKQVARAFVDHQGAAVIVATIRSMRGALSLRGATRVHMADFDTDPSAMEQAEDRPFEPGSTGLSITHYVVRESIDDDLAASVIPKFRAKDRILNDENARDVIRAFATKQEAKETAEEAYRRHIAHLATVDDDE